MKPVDCPLKPVGLPLTPLGLPLTPVGLLLRFITPTTGLPPTMTPVGPPDDMGLPPARLVSIFPIPVPKNRVLTAELFPALSVEPPSVALFRITGVSTIIVSTTGATGVSVFGVSGVSDVSAVA